ncbi:H-X9-DG-CTERM domain-containing protein [Planctomycetota bacterium]
MGKTEQRSFGGCMVGVALLGVVLLLLIGMLLGPDRVSERRRRRRCAQQLKELAQGLAVYVDAFGRGNWYPCPVGRGAKLADYNGAEWLASLYWTGVVSDPEVYICPSSPDTNGDGRDLGRHRATTAFGSQTVSYAGMHYRSLSDSGAAIPASFPPSPAATPMACDDTQGAINHGERNNGGMNVLFFDGHIEFKRTTGFTDGQPDPDTFPGIDLERGVGQTGGLLWRLRN